MYILIIIAVLFLIYRVAFEVPKDIKNLENKIDMLKFHLHEIELKLTQLDKKIDNNNEL
jgi:predicted Holliday junction resolvase-like endonuclease